MGSFQENTHRYNPKALPVKNFYTSLFLPRFSVTNIVLVNDKYFKARVGRIALSLDIRGFAFYGPGGLFLIVPRLTHIVHTLQLESHNIYHHWVSTELYCSSLPPLLLNLIKQDVATSCHEINKMIVSIRCSFILWIHLLIIIDGQKKDHK